MLNRFLLTIGLLLYLASVGEAKTFYVSTTGLDSRSCAQSENLSTPRRTIAKGIECLQADPLGNRLEIRGGSYPERLRSPEGIVWPSGTSWSDAPVISNFGIEVVTLNPSGEEILMIGGTTSYLHINGIVFDAINNRPGIDPDFGILGGNATIQGTNVSYIRISNSEFKNSAGSGMYIEADNLEILNSSFHHNGDTGGDHGIYWSRGSNGLIEGNRFYSNSGYGLHIFDEFPYDYQPSNNIIRKNIFSGGGGGIGCTPGLGCAVLQTGMIVSSAANNNQVYNNIFYGNNKGLEISNQSDGTLVAHNVFYANNTAIEADATQTNSVARNNIISNNTVEFAEFGTIATKSHNLCYKPAGTTCTGTGTKNNQDPLFVNAFDADFRLQTSSPAIDAGTPLAAVTTDFIGTARPQGLQVDIGPYEINTGINPDPPAPALVAEFGFDQDALDNSGNGNDGTVAGAVYGLINGKYNEFLRFDGINDEVVVADDVSLDTTHEFTLSAWVRPLSNITDFKAIISKDDKYTLYAGSTGLCGVGMPMAGYEQGGYVLACHNTALVPNTWTHLSAVKDSVGVKLYRNGSLVASVAGTAILDTTAGALNIGSSKYGEFFHGDIDNVRIHNYALSGASSSGSCGGTKSEIQCEMEDPVHPLDVPSAPSVLIATGADSVRKTGADATIKSQGAL